jgi:hypothetical protein
MDRREERMEGEWEVVVVVGGGGGGSDGGGEDVSFSLWANILSQSLSAGCAPEAIGYTGRRRFVCFAHGVAAHGV